VARLVIAHPVAPGRGADHLAWCHEIRARRDELAASRERVGITRQVVWSHPPSDMAIVRIDADDPAAAIRALASSDDPFDRWYAQRECELHGTALLPDEAVPEVLADYADGEPDELDMFIAVAVPLRPGWTERFRESIAQGIATGTGTKMVELWDVRRLTIWLHVTSRGDVVVYEAVGDIHEMLRSLAEEQDPLMAAQRASVRDRFGLDLERESWPIPLPGFSWSSGAR
jgi:hypothetical protein